MLSKKRLHPIHIARNSIVVILAALLVATAVAVAPPFQHNFPDVTVLPPPGTGILQSPSSCAASVGSATPTLTSNPPAGHPAITDLSHGIPFDCGPLVFGLAHIRLSPLTCGGAGVSYCPATPDTSGGIGGFTDLVVIPYTAANDPNIGGFCDTVTPANDFLTGAPLDLFPSGSPTSTVVFNIPFGNFVYCATYPDHPAIGSLTAFSVPWM